MVRSGDIQHHATVAAESTNQRDNDAEGELGYHQARYRTPSDTSHCPPSAPACRPPTLSVLNSPAAVSPRHPESAPHSAAGSRSPGAPDLHRLKQDGAGTSHTLGASLQPTPPVPVPTRRVHLPTRSDPGCSGFWKRLWTDSHTRRWAPANRNLCASLPALSPASPL